MTIELEAGAGTAVRARGARVGGRPVVTACIGPTDQLGALTEDDGPKLARAADEARRLRRPLVVHVCSTGALVQDGLPASYGWGTAARALVRASGVVPLIFTVDGPAIAGVALLLGLADQVVVTEAGYAFLTGPRIVRQITGVPVTTTALGGAGVLQRHAGLASLVVRSRAEVDDAVADLLSFLPGHNDAVPPRLPTADPADRPTPDAATLLPASPTGGYDVRDVLQVLLDDGELLEVHAAWAPNLVTALASLDGRPVGVVANQPTSIAGTLDIAASQKGARFVAFCDAFNLPLVTLVDTPGFSPGRDLEWRGMIRHGAQLAFAYARATVPRISLTLRKSYGGAYIVMDSKTMGNDLALAWPTAEVAVMGAAGAVEILHRGADDGERGRRIVEYEDRLLNPYVAAERGLIDAVIEPTETRRHLCIGLAVLDTKREHLSGRPHDNTPL